MIQERYGKGKSKQGMSSRGVTRISVHVHHRTALGAYTGPYDFWTLVLADPILSGMAAIFVYDLMKLLARKAVTLLKGATTRGKRVDMLIQFGGQDWVIVRVIGSLPQGEDAGGIPSEGEVYGALASATAMLQNASEKSPRKPLVVSAELHVTTGPTRLQIDTTVGSELGPAAVQQVAEAKSEKPISFRVDELRGATSKGARRARATRRTRSPRKRRL